MLTLTQINAESQTPALTDQQLLTLYVLVSQFAGFANGLGLFATIKDVLALEQATPTVKTQGLKAVLTALDALPEIVVESQGRADAPSHFATKENWDSLALDVLNILYDLPPDLFVNQHFALAYAKIDSVALLRSKVIFWTNPENRIL